jgi:hypothetical protein
MFIEIKVHKYIDPDLFSGTKLQMRLAELLEEEGADIIQTEGGKCSSPTKPGVLGLIEKVARKCETIYNTLYCIKHHHFLVSPIHN